MPERFDNVEAEEEAEESFEALTESRGSGLPPPEGESMSFERVRESGLAPCVNGRGFVEICGDRSAGRTLFPEDFGDNGERK